MKKMLEKAVRWDNVISRICALAIQISDLEEVTYLSGHTIKEGSILKVIKIKKKKKKQQEEKSKKNSESHY